MERSFAKGDHTILLSATYVVFNGTVQYDVQSCKDNVTHYECGSFVMTKKGPHEFEFDFTGEHRELNGVYTEQWTEVKLETRSKRKVHIDADRVRLTSPEGDFAFPYERTFEGLKCTHEGNAFLCTIEEGAFGELITFRSGVPSIDVFSDNYHQNWD